MEPTCDAEIDWQIRQFGQNVRAARKQAGLSQIALASEAELDRAAVSFLERAGRAPNLPTLVRVAHAAGVRPASLLAGVGSSDVSIWGPQPEERMNMDAAADPVYLFGMNLRSIRVRATLSQETLAYTAGLDRAAVSVLERGKRAPNLRTILKLARALEVSPGVLLSGIA